MFFSKAYNRIKKQGFVQRDGHDDFENFLRKSYSKVQNPSKQNETIQVVLSKSNKRTPVIFNNKKSVKELIRISQKDGSGNIEIRNYHIPKDIKIYFDASSIEHKLLDYDKIMNHNNYFVTAA